MLPAHVPPRLTAPRHDAGAGRGSGSFLPTAQRRALPARSPPQHLLPQWGQTCRAKGMLVASPGPHPGGALPAGTAGGGFGDTAAPYGADGATVLRRSPVASPAPAPSIPGAAGPHRHGSSSTHGAGAEGGSEEGTRTGDRRRSHTRAVPDGRCVRNADPARHRGGVLPPTPRGSRTEPPSRGDEGSLPSSPAPPPHSLPRPKNGVIGSEP